MKIILLAVATFLFVEAKCQDTIKVKHIVLCTNIISRSTMDTIRRFYRKKKVRSGYIIDCKDGYYIVDGKKLKLKEIK